MNDQFLANAALRAAAKVEAFLSKDVQEKVALAHVATWINQQDHSLSPAIVLRTATLAMTRITAHFAA